MLLSYGWDVMLWKLSSRNSYFSLWFFLGNRDKRSIGNRKKTKKRTYDIILLTLESFVEVNNENKRKKRGNN